MTDAKNERIVIRCHKELKQRFREFAVVHNFFYDKALTHLLDYYEGKVSKLPIKTYP